MPLEKTARIANVVPMTADLNPVHAALSRLGVLALRGLGAAMMHLPPSAWEAAAGGLAPLLWSCLPRYRKVATENLLAWGRTPKEARSLGIASFRSNLLVFFESLAMPRLVARRGVRVENRISPAAETALARIRTGEVPLAVGLSGHTGTWEFLGAELARLCAPVPVAVSARLVKNPVLARFLVDLRGSFGLELVEKDEFLRFLVRQEKRKIPRVYVFLCDQHFKGGLKVPFLGRDACTVGVPATVILKYDPPAFLGRCVRRKAGDYLIEIDRFDTAPYRRLPAAEAAREITAAVNRHIGETIAMAPEQWTWGHRRWRPCCGGPPGR